MAFSSVCRQFLQRLFVFRSVVGASNVYNYGLKEHLHVSNIEGNNVSGHPPAIVREEFSSSINLFNWLPQYEHVRISCDPTIHKIFIHPVGLSPAADLASITTMVLLMATDAVGPGQLE